MSQETTKEVFHNPKQIDFLQKMCHTNCLIWGRATGKTEGPVSDFSLYNIQTMPRSVGFLAGVSYESILTKIIPGIKKGWANWGYNENEHYFIRKFAPTKWNWEKPLRSPEKADYFIQWYNGSGILLLSLDRAINNGTSTDWASFDEARFFKKDKVDEITLTVRDNIPIFGKLWNHRSILYTSDMPKTSAASWLFEFETLMDSKKTEVIMKANNMLNSLFLQYQQAEKNPTLQAKIHKEIRKYEIWLNELRRNATLYMEASTLDNINVLGIDVIKDFKKNLSDLTFRTSVLNKKMIAVENGFYSAFDPEKHGYYASNYSYIDGLDLDFSQVKKDSRWDSDVKKDNSLIIGMDYNSAIYSMVVGQEVGKELKIVNNLYVLNSSIEALVERFCNYYSNHGRKEVVYCYDVTAIKGNKERESSPISMADEVIKQFTKRKWIVTRKYINRVPSYRSRYLLNKLLFSNDTRLSKFSYNRNNCEELEIALQNVATKQVKEGFEKDKSSEKDINVKPQHSVHPTDALDTLIWATQRHKINIVSSGGGSTTVL
jgi:hypothetical protein